LWVLRTGAPWRDLPPGFGAWKSAYERFRRWCTEGTWHRIHQALLGALDDSGRLDHELWFVDGSSVRASRSAAGARRSPSGEEPEHHALGRSRGGYGTKLHLLCDRHGTPLAVTLSPGQRHESLCFERTMDSVKIPTRRGRPRQRPHRLGADKGYSYSRIRRWLRQRGIGAVIPTRKNQRATRLDRAAYRERNVVERCVCVLKEARRVATRYEKLARHYLGMVTLAMIGCVLGALRRPLN
jgi:transposase